MSATYFKEFLARLAEIQEEKRKAWTDDGELCHPCSDAFDLAVFAAVLAFCAVVLGFLAYQLWG